MSVLLAIVAAIELLGGLLVWAASKTVIHEILGMLAIGFAFLTAGLAAVISEIALLRKVLLTRQAP